jgi:hypothetical protein
MVLDFAAQVQVSFLNMSSQSRSQAGFQQTRTVIERGYEQWAVGNRTMGLIDARDIFITKLVNCGGSHWQMELWVPRRGVPMVPSHPWH